MPAISRKKMTKLFETKGHKTKKLVAMFLLNIPSAKVK